MGQEADVGLERIGEYEVKGLLGRGGFGEAYRAANRHTGKEVAVKVFRPQAGNVKLAASSGGDALGELRRHAGDRTADQCIGYVENNRSRMRYPAYREMGLPIGSGMVESSCRTLVGERLKCAGMRWSRVGTNDVMALRACVRSERYDDFWHHRHKPPPLAA